MEKFITNPTTPQPSVVDAAPTESGVVKSAARVFRIFEFFDDVQREARLTEISSRLDMPTSSASVLLHSLVRLGYLSHDPERRAFKPTLRICMLGSWATGELMRDGWYKWLMDDLSARTGDTISIAARNGIFAQYIRIVNATNDLRVHVPTGTRRLLVWSAAGFALLKDADEAEIASLVRRTNAEERSGEEPIELRKVLAHVEHCREQGYFFSRELVTPGGGHIAMTIPPASTDAHEPAYSLGVAGWVDRIARDEKGIVQIMRTALRSRSEP